MYYQVCVNHQFQAICELTEVPSYSQLQEYVDGPLEIVSKHFPDPFVVVIRNGNGITRNLKIGAFAVPGWSTKGGPQECHPTPICGNFVILAQQEGVLRPLTKGELSCVNAFLMPVSVLPFHKVPNATEFYIPGGENKYRKVPRAFTPIDHNSEVLEHSGMRIGVFKFPDGAMVAIPDYADARLTS